MWKYTIIINIFDTQNLPYHMTWLMYYPLPPKYLTKCMHTENRALWNEFKKNLAWSMQPILCFLKLQLKLLIFIKARNKQFKSLPTRTFHFDKRCCINACRNMNLIHIDIYDKPYFSSYSYNHVLMISK